MQPVRIGENLHFSKCYSVIVELLVITEKVLWYISVYFSGMNSALVLIILLLAVPLQLFLSHYINSIYAAGTTADSAVSGKGGKEAPRTIETVRREALDR